MINGLRLAVSAVTLLLIGTFTGLAQSNETLPDPFIDLINPGSVFPQSDNEDQVKIEDRITDLNDTQDVWDQICSEQNGINSSIVQWVGNSTEVRCLNLRPTITTSIVFPPQTLIVTTILGDDKHFKAKAVPQRKNILTLDVGAKVGVDTQLTVFTGERDIVDQSDGNFSPSAENIYTFYLRSFDVQTANTTNLTVFVTDNAEGNFQKPTGRIQSYNSTETSTGGEEINVARLTEPSQIPETETAFKNHHYTYTGEKKGEYLRAISFDASNLRFEDYQIYAADQDSASIAPVRAFHDGTFTYLDFGEDGRSDRMLNPVILQVVDDIDSLVNKRRIGPSSNIVVVETIGNLTIRNGARVVCVVFRGSPVSTPPDVEIGLPSQAASQEGQTRQTAYRESSEEESSKFPGDLRRK